MSSINGLTFVPDFITPEEEKHYLEFIYEQKWNKELTRRTQHYGSRYVYRTRSLEHDVPAVPDIFKALSAKIKAAGLTTLDFDQVIVNEYTPGQGIAAHTDHKTWFDSDICTLSLKAPINMDFTARNVDETIRLEPRSIVVLKGYARSVVRHGIRQVKEDVVDGVTVPRQTRVSITFRKIKAQHKVDVRPGSPPPFGFF
jgi:alkylated DNA repair dioxygenase AlkB